MTASLASALSISRHWLEEYARLWQRILVITGVLLLTIVATRGITLLTAAVVVMPIGITGALLLLRKPHLGPLLLIVTGLVVDIGMSDNFNATVLLLVFLTGLWTLSLLLNRQLWDGFRSPPVRPLFYLVGIAVLAAVQGQLPWYPVAPAPLEAQIGGIAVYALSAAAFLLVATSVRQLRWLEAMVWIFLLIGSLYVFARVLPRPFRFIQMFFPWGSTSCLYWLWLIVHAFSQSLLNQRLHVLVRLFLVALVGAALYAVLVQTYDWKSGWIPPLVAIAAILVLRWPKLLFIGVVAVLPALPYAIADLIAGDSYSYSTRVDAWLIVLEILQANPVLGLGPSNYYWYTPLFAIRGYSVNFNSHSQYIDLLAQTGIVGLIAYLWFFAVVGLLGWQLLRRANTGFVRAYIYGSLGGLCGMFVAGALGDWILPFVYNVGLVGMRSSVLGWLFLGGLSAIQCIYARELTGINGDAHGQSRQKVRTTGLSGRPHFPENPFHD